MAIAQEIPAEIEIVGSESEVVEMEKFANFLRDLVFLHDRLWIIAAKDLREHTLDSGYFYSRYGRPVPKDQRIQLVSVHKGSPFSVVFALAGAGVVATIALPYFKLLRGALLLPGELKKQQLDAKKTETEITINELKEIQLTDEIKERRRTVRVRGPAVVRGLEEDLESLRRRDSPPLEEIGRVITRDVERLGENEIVVTDVVVRRYRKVSDDQ